MILVVDNYDSFTYNLVQLLRVLGAEVEVRRNDAISADEAEALRPEGVVISPGPGGPAHAGHAPELVRRLAGSCPILGVCLGHQIIGHVFGARVVRAPLAMHGKTTTVRHDGRGVFTGVGQLLEAGLYHSLAISDDGLPAELVVSARSETGVIMGVRHARHAIEGVQFHPESILTSTGETIMANFLTRPLAPVAS